MADGVKLASGYIELTVKKAGDAMKEITAEITGVGKQAEKAGKDAGDALNKGISKGAKDAGKAINEEITKSAKDAGSFAGKSAGDAIEAGIGKGAKGAGKAIEEEIGKATKKASDDASKTKIEPKVEPKVNTGRVKDELRNFGKDVAQTVNKGLQDAGVSTDAIVTEIAKRAGAKIGQELHDAVLNVPYLGDAVRNVGSVIDPVVEGFHGIGDAITGIKEKDAAGTLNGLAAALNAVGQTQAGSAVQDVANKAAPLQEKISTLKGDIEGTTEGFLMFAGNSGRISGAFTAIAAAAGPLAGTLAALDTLMPGWQNAGANVLDQIQGKQPVNPKDWVNTLVPGTNLLDSAMGWGHQQRPAAPAEGPPAPPAPPPITAPATDFYRSIPKRAKGGVTPAGRIYGPGTGVSDSIVGIGADGVPTARVSAGEGVVRKSAMDNGGAAIVAALNSGTVPRFDDGGVVPPAVPMPAVPPIKVPEATTGQAGDFNAWLNTQQGKPYQYGTLYDCSGFMSQIYNKITGKSLPRFNTESDLAAYGFVRGSKPGTFQLGIHHGGGGPNSHMAGTLPDGRAVESAGNGVQIGAGAHGANDPQFEDHWFLPGSELGSALTGGAPGQLAAMLGGMSGGQGDPASPSAAGGPGAGLGRTQGYIPAGAGGGGTAGTSLWSGAMQMGAQAINGLIEQAASAASTAISAAATAGSFGAGGQAGGAASSFLIGIGTKMAERGVQYGFQMAGIGGDALAEILLPFGVPRFFQTDPSQFMPQLPGQAAAVTTGEKAQDQQQGLPTPSPTAPVQPGQMPGQQVIGAPAPIATAGTGDLKPAPTPMQGLSGSQPQGPAVPTPQAPGPPAPVQGPQPVQGPKPPQAPPPGTEPLRPTDLAGLLGLSRGGVVPGVFDSGGWLMPNGIAINQTKRPEPILNDQQWSDVHAIARQGMPAPDPKAVRGGGDDYSMHFGEGSIVVKDVEEFSREMESRQRLQRWRYGGRP